MLKSFLLASDLIYLFIFLQDSLMRTLISFVRLLMTTWTLANRQLRLSP